MAEQRPTPIKDAYQLFLLDCEARRFTAATLAYYRHRLGRFIQWAVDQQIAHVQDLNSNHIKQYMIALQQRNLSGYSLFAEYRTMRRFCNFAISEGWITESPIRKVKAPQVDKDIRRLFTPTEVKKLLDACQNDREEALLFFLIDTGLRLAEVVALSGEHVDLTTGTVKVKQGKGRKERVVFLGVAARKQMLRYYLEQWGTSQGPGEKQPVWVNVWTEKRLTKSGLAQLLTRIGKRADVKQCTTHAFRRTHATWSLRSGMPLPTLRQLMGHSDLSVILRYLGLTEEDLKDAHGQYGPVDNMLGL